MSKTPLSDRAIAAFMARAVMFIIFIGSGLSLFLMLTGSSAAMPVCLGFGAGATIVLFIGAYFVARARTSE